MEAETVGILNSATMYVIYEVCCHRKRRNIGKVRIHVIIYGNSNGGDLKLFSRSRWVRTAAPEKARLPSAESAAIPLADGTIIFELGIRPVLCRKNLDFFSRRPAAPVAIRVIVAPAG